MSLRNTSNNRLIRRVRRHSSLSILFRTMDSKRNQAGFFLPPLDYNSDLLSHSEERIGQEPPSLEPALIPPSPSSDTPALDTFARPAVKMAGSTERPAGTDPLIGPALKPSLPLAVVQPASITPTFEPPPPVGPASIPAKQRESELFNQAQPVHPAPIESSPVPPTESDSDNDLGWRKLKAIYQKHQEKNSTEADLTSPTPPETKPAALFRPAEKSTLPESASIQREAAAPVSQARFHPAVQTQPALPTPEEISPTQIDSAPNKIPPQEQTFQEKRLAVPLETPFNQPVVQTFAEGSLEPSTLPAENNPVQRKVRENPTLESGTLSEVGPAKMPVIPTMQDQSQTPVSSNAPQSASHQQAQAHLTPNLSQPDSYLNDQMDAPRLNQQPLFTSEVSLLPDEQLLLEHETDHEPDRLPVRSLPLESVWPVQRQGHGPVISERFETEPGAAAWTSSEVEPFDPTVEENIRNTLAEITTRQPTDSMIEVITPRRSRPGPSVQPQMETNQDVAPPIQTVGGITAAATIQRQPEPQAGSLFPEESHLIKTEIGPLPDDLWHLLGQTPPSPAPLPSSTTETGRMVSRAEATEASALHLDVAHSQEQNSSPTTLPVSFTTGSQEPSSGPQTDPSSVRLESENPALPGLTTDTNEVTDQSGQSHHLQRAIETSTVTPDQETSSAGTTDQKIEAGSAAQIDTDELAHQVYVKLKRRLAVEWERLRRR